jgi:hypothetical protein
MCGGSSKATPYVAQPNNYTPTAAPYGTSGTATPASAGSAQAAAYPSYSNRYQPAQGISQQNLAMLQALRNRVMSRYSGQQSQEVPVNPGSTPDGSVNPSQNVPTQLPNAQVVPAQYAPWTGGGHLPAQSPSVQSAPAKTNSWRGGATRGGVL